MPVDIKFKKFKVGDEVVISTQYPTMSSGSKNFDNVKAKLVVVTDDTIGVEFNKDIGGHDCDGKGKSGHCWYYTSIHVISIEFPIDYFSIERFMK